MRLKQYFKTVLAVTLTSITISNSYANFAIPTVDVGQLQQGVQVIAQLRQQLTEARNFYNNNIKQLRNQLNTQIDQLRAVSGFNEIKGLYDEIKGISQDVTQFTNDFSEAVERLSKVKLTDVYKLTDREAYEQVFGNKKVYNVKQLSANAVNRYIGVFKKMSKSSSINVSERDKLEFELKKLFDKSCSIDSSPQVIDHCMSQVALGYAMNLSLQNRQKMVNQQIELLLKMMNEKPATLKDSIDLANRINANIEFLNISVSNYEKVNNELRREISRYKYEADRSWSDVYRQALKYRNEQHFGK